MKKMLEKKLSEKHDPVISPELEKQLRGLKKGQTALCIVEITGDYRLDDVITDLEKAFGVTVPDGGRLYLINTLFANLTRNQAYAVAEKPYVRALTENRIIAY